MPFAGNPLCESPFGGPTGEIGLKPTPALESGELGLLSSDIAVWACFSFR